MCIAAIAAGCAHVDPKPDYRRTAEIITERTGIEDVYSPKAESLIEEKVAALLDGGLTAVEAPRVALLNNREFQARFHAVGMSRADVVASGLLSNPSLGLSLRFPEGGGLANLSFGFAQQLADLWRIPVRKRIARQELEQTVLSVAGRAVELVSEAEVSYWRLLSLQQTESLAREDVELARRSQELAGDRFTAGETGKLDVNLARAALLDARRRLITLRREIRTARADLARTLGLSRWHGDWALSGELPAADGGGFDEDALLAAALTQRLDARAAAMQLRANESRIRQQIMKAFPDVSIGVEGERPERRAIPGRKIKADMARASVRAGKLSVPDLQTRGERRMERSQIIDLLLGPTLDITLPIWHQNQPQIARARYEAARQRREYENLLDAIAQDVVAAAAAASAAAELAAFQHDQTLPLARENVEAARRAYQAGRQSIVALMDAQKALITQRRAYVDARRDYAVALAELRRAIGGADPLGVDVTADNPTSSNPVEIDE